jgi:beta-lactamase class A
LKDGKKWVISEMSIGVNYSALLLLTSLMLHLSATSQPAANNLLETILAKEPALFSDILNRKDELRVQLIYTQIERGKKGKVKFTDHSYNLNSDTYFYPASTVKLPVAILALQKLNELNIPTLNRNTTMLTGRGGEGQTAINNDPSAADGRPTIAHYIKKILLVSDNDAFNRLYEFLGQEYINNSLHKMGYPDVQIIHRLSVSLTDEQNRHTNPVKFADSTGRIIYEKPAEYSQLAYKNRETKSDSYRMGKGFYSGGELIHQPFDFSTKNVLPLNDLHSIIKSIIFPDAVPKEKRFNLTTADYDFLRLYMSMRPGESVTPDYNTATYWDNYVKMLYYGNEKTKPEPGVRIFNKTGTAYGFLIDACYFADYENNIEFILSATILCNSDGIFNDDKYDYQTLGYPFMKKLGRSIYSYERTIVRKKKQEIPPNLFSYTE